MCTYTFAFHSFSLIFNLHHLVWSSGADYVGAQLLTSYKLESGCKSLQSYPDNRQRRCCAAAVGVEEKEQSEARPLQKTSRRKGIDHLVEEKVDFDLFDLIEL